MKTRNNHFTSKNLQNSFGFLGNQFTKDKRPQGIQQNTTSSFSFSQRSSMPLFKIVEAGAIEELDRGLCLELEVA